MISRSPSSSACGTTDEPVAIAITDEGTVSVDDEGMVEVASPGCLSSSCDTLLSATCAPELVGDQVVVHAEAVIESEGDTCTTDCGIVQTTCTLAEIVNPSAVVIFCGGVETALDAE